MALSLEFFTTGSLNMFGHQGDENLDKRVVVFDINDLREELKLLGHMIITDTTLNRVILNWKKGKRTRVFIDELHVMFEDKFSAEFFNSAWREFRKRNDYPAAITQNVEFLLDSPQGRSILPIGIFFSGKSDEKGGIPQGVREINKEYQSKVVELCASLPRDEVEMAGKRAP